MCQSASSHKSSLLVKRLRRTNSCQRRMMMAVVTEVTVQLRMKKRRNIFQFAKIQSEYIETILISLPQKNLRKTLFLFSHSSPSTSATLFARVFYTAEDTVMRDLKFFLRKSTCSFS
ncbi:uncharacterized protein [Chanodichthys erythropterus]|uniref:uncharacterized protein isoform X2 n=1 Tax=Chanodichthys erythropterus TaxID=933992 RepID=UPI00351EE94F